MDLISQGADIIDLGAQSTRPNYSEITPEEEWSRLQPVITGLRKADKSIPVSVDTYFPYVAENALKAGADIINDVSGVVTPKMAKIVKNTDCGWILMHNGSGSVPEVDKFFKAALKQCLDYGIEKEHICLDMGIGFGKDYNQNLELISKIGEYKPADLPLLLGTSRKRVIGQGSRQEIADKRVYGNIAADTVAVLGGVDIIRLHDVENEKQGIYMAEELKKAGVQLG